MATVIIQKRERANRNSYIIYYKDPFSGKRKYYKTFPKKRDAQIEANNLRTLLDSGQTNKVIQAKQKKSAATFSEVADEIKKAWDIKRSEGNLAQVTLDGYQNILGLLSNEFGDRRLFQITKDELVDYRIQLSGKSSPVNANRQLFVIKQVFKQGVELGILQEDVSASIKKLSEKAHERNKFLVADQLRTLIKATELTKAKHYLPAIIWLSAEHGSSHQEILDLRWSDVLLDGDNESIRFFRTKNQKERTFTSIGQESKKALIHWRDYLTKIRKKKKFHAAKSDYVFCRINTGKRINSFRTAWRKAKLTAGLEQLHFHDLRHTFCSNLAIAGANIKDIQEMIGHHDISMTSRYTHLTNNRMESLQKLLEKQYESADVSM